MSQWRGQFDADSPFEAAVNWLSKWYQVPTLLLLIVFILWTRARTWGSYVVDGTVLFSGNDAWYHYREVTYVTENWPATIPYDVWTNFPTGTSVSQFGTILDQTVATVALIVGLGNPSDNTVRMVMLFTPAVLGALTAIPTYYLGKRLGGKLSGLIAVLVLALSTGELMRRSLVGFADHHVAEALTQAFAVLAIVVAIQVADSETPVWELVVDRDLSGLRRPLLYATLAGVATAIYLWTWPPGTLLLGIFGVYVTLQLWLSYLRGRSPEPVAMTAAVVFGVTAVLMFVPIDTVGFDATSFSLLQPALALAGVVWCVVLAWIARLWDDNNYATWAYPLPSLGLLAVGTLVVALGLPDVFDLFVKNVQRVLVPGSTGGAATVAEVQSLPWSEVQSTFYVRYGLATVIAGVGALLAIGFALFGEETRSELLFLSVWLAIMTLAAITQQRFGYYMTIPVATMTAYVVGLGVKYVGTISGDDDGFETYQVLVVAIILMLLVVPMGTATTDRGNPAHVVNQTDSRHNPGPGGVIGWSDSLNWMEDNTPTEGTFAGADSGMEPYATNAKTDDFDYPAGSYGVISWWDYGHWITTIGERIPVANPFQQSATDAARFLLAGNESRADAVLAEMSDGENRDTRYVIVDWQMVWPTSKFSAPVVFHPDLQQDDMFEYLYGPAQNGGGLQRYLPSMTQRYYESQMVRLYYYHGSGFAPGAVATDYDEIQTQDGETIKILPGLQSGQRSASAFRRFNNSQQTQQFLDSDNTSHRGGFGIQPRERVSALEHYRLVKTSESPARTPGVFNLIRQYQQLGSGLRATDFVSNLGWSKVFERVPGATIQGSGAPANATVAIQVPMMDDGQQQPFRYQQLVQADANGEFNATVPYSSTGYGNFGPGNGYTNTSVRAMDSYRARAQTFVQRNGTIQSQLLNASFDVSEGQVVGENESAVRIELTPVDGSDSGGDSNDGSGQDDSGSLVGPGELDERTSPRVDAAG